MLSVKDIIKATSGKIVSGGNNYFSGVSIDSRTIREGELFIALKGDRFDGHDFMEEALKIGSGVIISSKSKFQNSKSKGKTVILVDNTLLALHDLARYLRKRFKGHVIGVVGSNGKTTTKELISSVLSTKLNVHKTIGNLNNHIGMPLCIINWFRGQGISGSPDVMVIEMGANRPGDIDELCSIAFPEVGVITNIGYEHLEGFGSLHKVRDSELEILPYLKRLIVNADDQFLMEGIRSRIQKAEHRGQIEVITFGIDAGDADLTVRDIVFSEDGTRFSICAKNECIGIYSKLLGRFNVYNSLAAASAAYAVGLNLHEIKDGLESFDGVKARFEIKKYKGATFLNDVYNANPSSMEESVNELIRLLQSKYKRAIAVLGDMLELGYYGIAAHKQLGQRLSELPVDIFIGVGPLMSLAVNEFKGKGIPVDTSDDAGLELGKILREGDIVLIKGSRGMKMEGVLESLVNSHSISECCNVV